MHKLVGTAFAVCLALVPVAPVQAVLTQAQPGGQAEVEISYIMPPAWVAQAVQGGPELKAHYVYMSGGRPYGEMYLSQTPAPAGRTLDQVFQDGLGQAKPGLPYYQARGTQRVSVGGAAAVVHDFVYMPSGSGVMFAGRTYTMISGTEVFTFFFQTVSTFAASMQSQGAQVMGSVAFVAKPAPAIAPAVNPGQTDPAAARADATRAVTRSGGGLTAEDMGLQYDLPPGWQQVDDPMGAKYRCFGPGGGLTASLFMQKPVVSVAGLAALFGASPEETLASTLRAKVDEEYKGYQGYTPAATVKRTIAGFPGLVHDFTFLLNNRKVFYRWVIFAVPQKDANPNVRVAPTIQPFAFLAGEPERAAELARQWDVIIDSMRVKGAAVPPPAPPRPETKGEGGLPDLQSDEPAAGLYADPFGRYRVALPAGAVQVKVEDNAGFFRMPAAKTEFIVHSYRQEETGARLAARLAEGRKPNGAPSRMTVAGREVSVSLYTGRDEAGSNMVWVVAVYPESGLLMVVKLPAKDYAGAKDWIAALIRGVVFLAY